MACATARPGGMTGASARRWVGTWACGPQLTEPGNNPPAPGLGGNTLPSQLVYTSLGGERLRVRLSNEFGDAPVTMRAVHVAASAGGDAIHAGTDRALAFSGAAAVTIPAGQSVWSDAFDFALAHQARIAISVNFGAVPAGITGHPGSRTTSYLAPGDAVSSPRLAGAATTDHWYYITGIDVMADAAAAAVVTLGDSLTDGRGSTTNGNDRWPDNLSRRLRANAPTAKVAVLNVGIGGNAVASGGLGPAAVQRFTRDVLGQSGVRWLIVFEGVNDICGPNGAQAAQDLIAAYGRFIDSAHAQGFRRLRRAADAARRVTLRQPRPRGGPSGGERLNTDQRPLRRGHRPGCRRPRPRQPHSPVGGLRHRRSATCTSTPPVTRSWPTRSTSRCS